MTSSSSDKFKRDVDIENLPNPWPESTSEFGVVTLIQTCKACPHCGISIGVMVAPDGSSLEQFAQNLQEQYNKTPPPDEFSEGYAEPIFVYCDNPGCPFQAVVEYARIRSVITEWCEDDAPSWSEYVTTIAHNLGWI